MTDKTQNDNTENASGVDIEALTKQLKKQILAELKDDEKRKEEEAKQRRIDEKASQEQYIETMKNSPDPWVDILGWVETEQGVKVELEWNDAFVKYLRSNGISGSDEEQVVQRWVTMLLRDMVEQFDETSNSESDFE